MDVAGDGRCRAVGRVVAGGGGHPGHLRSCERGVAQGEAGDAGLLVRDRQDRPVVYLICEPSTRYYHVATRAEWMPALLGEVI